MNHTRGSRSPSSPPASTQWPFERRFSGGGGDPFRDDSGQVVAHRRSSFTSELRGSITSPDAQSARKEYLEDLAKQIEEKKKIEKQATLEEDRREQQRAEYWERQSAQTSPRSIRSSSEFRRGVLSAPTTPKSQEPESYSRPGRVDVSAAPRSINQLFSPSGNGPLPATSSVPPFRDLRSERDNDSPLRQERYAHQQYSSNTNTDVESMDMESLKREVLRLRAALTAQTQSYGSCQCPQCHTPLSMHVEQETVDRTTTAKWTVKVFDSHHNQRS